MRDGVYDYFRYEVYVCTYYIKHSLYASFTQETKPDGSAIDSFLAVYHKVPCPHCSCNGQVFNTQQRMNSCYFLNSVSIVEYSSNEDMTQTIMN